MTAPIPPRPQNGAPLFASPVRPPLARGTPSHVRGAPIHAAQGPRPVNPRHTWAPYEGLVIRTTFGTYVVGKEIGRGGQAVVHIGTESKTGDAIAIKFFDYRALMRERKAHLLQAEMQGLKSIDHPNIVYFEGGNAVGDKGWYATFFEYCMDGNLHQRISSKGRLPIDEAINYLYQILVAMQFLHQRGISHRDVKPDNFFLKGNIVKCGDFGMADWNLCEGMVWGYCGTLNYLAPEILKDYRRGAGFRGAPADIYAVGCTAYEMLTGASPVTPLPQLWDSRLNPHVHKVLEGIWRVPIVGVELRKLLRGLVCEDPSRRLTADEALMSPVFRRSREPSLLPQALRRPGLLVPPQSPSATDSSNGGSPSATSISTPGTSAKPSPARPLRPLPSVPLASPPLPQRLAEHQLQELYLVPHVTSPRPPRPYDTHRPSKEGGKKKGNWFKRLFFDFVLNKNSQTKTASCS